MCESNQIDQERRFFIRDTLAPFFNEACHLDSFRSVEAEFEKLGLQKDWNDMFVLRLTQISENISTAKYQAYQYFIEDIMELNCNIRSIYQEGPWFKLAQELGEFIDKRLVPFVDHLEHFKQFSVLKEPAFTIRLDQNFSLEGANKNAFNHLDDGDRLKLLLTWPLPRYNKSAINPKMKATANITKNETIANDQIFVIDETKFLVHHTSFYHLLKYTVHLKSNEIGHKNFIDHYVVKYLQTADLNQELSRVRLNDTAQCFQNLAFNEKGIEMMLYVTLYLSLKPLIESTLDNQRQTVSNKLMEVISERHYIKIQSDNKTNIEILSNVDSVLKTGTKFFGINSFPDLEIGYTGTLLKLNRNISVYFTGIGEIKYVTFNLKLGIEGLKGSTRWDFDPEELKKRDTSHKAKRLIKRQSLIKEVEDTLFKYTTLSVHLGNTRYVLCDYDSFLLVKLKFEKVNCPDHYGTARGEVAQHISSEYEYFSSSETFSRLYFVSFFSFNNQYLDEINLFRKLVNETLAEKRDSLTGGSDDNDDQGNFPPWNPPSSNSSDPKSSSSNATDEEPKTPQNETSVHSQQLLSTIKESGVDLRAPELGTSINSNKVHKFDKYLFEKVFHVELGDVITDVIEIGDRISQVVLVDSGKFLNSILKNNVFVKGLVPELSVLKVYDPFLGQLVQYDELEEELVVAKYSYQDSINFIVKEVKAYCLLSKYAGEFMPSLYSYGRLSDVFAEVGFPYLRLCGGFIQMEYLENDEHLVIDKEFFQEKVLNAFEKMHDCDIIHNDIKYENFIFEKNGGFKIIDFSHAKFSTSRTEKDTEIQLVRKFFGF